MSDLSQRPSHLILADLIVEALLAKDARLHELAVEAAHRSEADLVGRLIREVVIGKRPARQRIQMLQVVRELGGLTHPDHFTDLTMAHAREKSREVKAEVSNLLGNDNLAVAFALVKGIAR